MTKRNFTTELNEAAIAQDWHRYSHILRERDEAEERA